MNKKESWFSTGYDGLDEMQKERDEERERASVSRFRLPMDGSAKLIFLDDAPFRFYEHQINLNGHWGNYFTCLERSVGGECPVCKMGDKSYYVGMYTVVNVQEWTDSKGNAHKNEKLIFPAKLDTLQLLKLKEERYGVKYCLYYVDRKGQSKQKTASVGNSFDFHKKIEVKNIPVEDINPFDYEELFKPKSKEEIEKILKGSLGEPPEDFGGRGKDDDYPY